MGLGTERATDVSRIEDDEDLDEEPGEVIESAPPQSVGEERELGASGLKKKLLKHGRGWETPEFGDEVTVHYVGTLLDGTKFDSTRDRDEPLMIKLGQGQVVAGLDQGVVTMKKEEIALFTLPAELGYGASCSDGVPPFSVIQFEVELLSWITVVDICKDGGVVKKIMEKGGGHERPSDLDEVLVKYQATRVDGTLVAQTSEEGIEFYIKNGHLCPALPKAIVTMRRGEKAKLLVQSKYAFEERTTGTDIGAHLISPDSMLNIDLELVSFKPVVDVNGDSNIIKKILKEGDGSVTANEGATVTISYLARLEDGTVFEKKGIDGGQPLQFITDEEQVIAGLDRAVATMKKGERAVVTIHHDLAFGNIEVKREFFTIPPCTNVVYEVELLDFIKEKTPWEMSNHEKIEAAERTKQEGNLLFKNGKYQRAAKKYDKAAGYVSEDGSFGGDEEKVAEALRVSCWLNGAACSLKSNDFQEAIKLCSKVLDVEFHNVKALYRRAQAYIDTSDFFLAELDFKKALEADPDNREVKSMQRTLKQLQVESNRRDAKLYANMFANLSKDSSPASKKFKVDKVEDETR